jgi:hypothetical protein
MIDYRFERFTYYKPPAMPESVTGEAVLSHLSPTFHSVATSYIRASSLSHKLPRQG